MSTLDANISKSAIQLIEAYLHSLNAEDSAALPKIFQKVGKWIAVHDQSILSIFYLDPSDQNKIVEFQKKGWNPFPAFFVPTGQDGPVAFRMGGTNGFFNSNRVSNMYAFKVQPGASFTVSGHFQEVTAPSGEKIQYKISLAFVLGLNENEQWESIEKRLKSLLENTMQNWKRVR